MDFTTARGRLRPSLRPMPMLTTGPMAMDWAATTAAITDLATGPMVTDMVSTTARGRLRPSLTTVSTLPTTLLLPSLATPTPLLSPTPSTLLPPLSPATPRSPPPPPSPPSALPTPPSPLLLEATLVPAATSPTPLEPSMLPRGRPRLSLAVLLRRIWTWLRTRIQDLRIWSPRIRPRLLLRLNLLGCLRSGCNHVADILSLNLTKSGIIEPRLIREVLPHESGEVQDSTFEIYILPILKKK